MIDDTFNTFSKIIIFLRKLFSKHSSFLEVDNKKIEKCIELSDFNKLKNLEKKKGFFENFKKEKPFFYKGKTKQWQNILDEKTVYKLEKKFKKEMIELRYISN